MFDAGLAHLRLLFERALAMTNAGFNKRQMKSLFKMYLECETKFGNSKSIQRVKDLATNYLTSISQ